METDQSETHQSDGDKASLANLTKRQAEVIKCRKKEQRKYQILFFLGIFLLGGIPVAYFFLPVFGIIPKMGLIPIALIYMVLPWMMLPASRQQRRKFDDELRELEFQIDLQRFHVSNIEIRAEKILHINDFQLRRYYDLNLSQNYWVFGLGIFCICLGVVIIAASLYLVLLSPKEDPHTQNVTAILGGTGALFTNVIAAIYLKMNTAASDNLAAFHTKLVQSNRLLLANLLVSRIENPEKRGSTLAALAVGLVGNPSEVTSPPR